MKASMTALVALCAVSISACDHGSARTTGTPVSRASGFPTASENAAIDAAALRLARERRAEPCSSVKSCQRATVFVDGKALSDGLISIVGRSLLVHDLGGRATATAYTDMMGDPKSAFLRWVLTASTYEALLRLDAASRLSSDEEGGVRARLEKTEQAIADGTISVTEPGDGQRLSGTALVAYEANLKQDYEVAALTDAYSHRPHPQQLYRDLIKSSLAKHSVEFTAGVGLTDADVLTYASQVTSGH